MDIAQWKSRVLFLIPGSMFDPQEALVNHTLSKSYYPNHERFLTNLLSFQELVNFGTSYLPLPFLNPTTYLPSYLTSTNWISSPYLINFPFSFFLCQGFVIGSIGLSLTLHTTKNKLLAETCDIKYSYQIPGTRLLMCFKLNFRYFIQFILIARRHQT